jgi:hypothetical protein
LVSDNSLLTQTNPVIIENSREGTADWQLTNPAMEREIEGYASATSINRGESIHLYINTGADDFVLEVYRMGWYQGLGGRKITDSITLPGVVQPMPALDPVSGLVDCNWVNPYKLNTMNNQNDTDWLSGVYLVKLTESNSGKQSYIIFTVRTDARAADVLMQQSVTTYQAYNNWGGKSLYKWNSSDNKRASKVSYNRPYAGNQQNPAAAYGVGAGEFICNVQPNNPDYPISNAGWEINMVRWLEREGYDVAYCTNLDVHHNSTLLLKYQAFISVGHDEYWTWEMRKHIELALDSCIHLGFFGANTGYWQVRFVDSVHGKQPNRVMLCHKSARRDPYSKLSQQCHLTTCQWRDHPANAPEAQLLGVMYCADPVDGDIVIINAQHWLFNGSGLDDGSRLPGLLGYEVDCVHGSSPDNLVVLANSPWSKLNDSEQKGFANMTIYSTEKGALVFAAGTIQWSWGLDDFNVPALRASRDNLSAQQITRNILQRFISSTME